MSDPIPVYCILEGAVASPMPAPFSIQFVRVPYDVEAEIAAATALGMPELEAYVVEIRDGIYRGDWRTGEAPTYHRRTT
jgi:hypothetical protein